MSAAFGVDGAKRRSDEPSAALREPLVTAMLGQPQPGAMLMVPLNKYAGDRDCDRCGRHVPEGETLWTGLHVVGRAVITFGLCAEHAEAEVAR